MQYFYNLMMEFKIFCPWHNRYSVGGFALDSVIRVIDSKNSSSLSPFHSSLFKKLINIRRGFTFNLEKKEHQNENARFIGSILVKLAQRGFPAPCSLKLERILLKDAEEKELLKSKEAIESGAFIFKIKPKIENLSHLLRTSYFLELILDDEEIEKLLRNYKKLCSPLEKEFFDLFYSISYEPRILLYLTPQRLFQTMIKLTRSSEEMDFIGNKKVDFAIELPKLVDGGENNKWLRIAIEIDDPSHIHEKEYDKKRDETLRKNGWEVYRFSYFKKNEWEVKIREILEKINKIIEKDTIETATKIRKMDAEQKNSLINLTLLPIVESQLMVIIGKFIYLTGKSVIKIANPQKLYLKPIINSIEECVKNLEEIYNLNCLEKIEITEENKADIIYFAYPSYRAWDCLAQYPQKTIAPTFVFSEYEESLPKDVLPRKIFSPKNLVYFLQNIFRKENFWEGQEKLVTKMLSLEPVVGVLPTAAGKSLCYQLSSLLQPGFTVVIQPLRSLMWDQQDNLNRLGIHRSTAIMSHGEVTQEEETNLKEEGYRSIAKGFKYFVFISPERFQIPEFRNKIKEFVYDYPITFCVVDEAHCVSEWGHDFRPAYLNLGKLIPDICRHKNYSPIFAALTGTASYNVQIDICRELNIEESAIIMPENFDRKELEFKIQKIDPRERIGFIINILRKESNITPGQPTYTIPSGLIFTFFVNKKILGAKYLFEEIKKELPNDCKDKITLYSGKNPYSYEKTEINWEKIKIEIQKKFKDNETPILVCTHSFGMGIDKPDIRFTIHAMLPRSLEEFYQHAGRGGRDRKKTNCYIIYADSTPKQTDEILNLPPEKMEEQIKEIERLIRKENLDDSIHNLWFIYNSFMGEKREQKIFEYVWHKFKEFLPKYEGDIYEKDIPFDFLPEELIQKPIYQKKLTFSKKNNKKDEKLKERKELFLEKAIYRFLIIGVVKDYMKDFSKEKFIIKLCRLSSNDIKREFLKYLKLYLTEGALKEYLPNKEPATFEEAVLEYGQKLIKFVYDYIVKRRIEAMKGILNAVRQQVNFREILLNYMTESKFTPLIKEILTEEKNYLKWLKILDELRGRDDIIRLYGTCRRFIEENPDNYAIRLLLGIAGLHYEISITNAFQDIKRAYEKIMKEFEINEREKIIKTLKKYLEYLFPNYLEEVLELILEIDNSREIVRLCYKFGKPDSKLRLKAGIIIIKNIIQKLIKWREKWEMTYY